MARGSDKAKKTKAKIRGENTKPAPPQSKQPERDLCLQQKCLDIFRDALKPQDQQTGTVQEVKGHLYNRDFGKAFSTTEYLQVYAARWSPSRAIGYLQVLSDISDHLFVPERRGEDGGEVHEDFSVCCIGGGAGAELVAIAAWISRQVDDLPFKGVNSIFLDIAAWGSVVSALYDASTSPPHLSKYASVAAKEANIALVGPKLFNANFQQLDALEMNDEEDRNVFSKMNMVTLMFTLNELYTTSIPKTQKMLARLTAELRPGSFLLVVDSPGSYSAVSVNGAEKKYPMQWLLDYTLLGAGQKAKTGERARWEKLVSDDSRWFRLPQGLRYPIDLENMRYQIHLYKTLDDIEVASTGRTG